MTLQPGATIDRYGLRTGHFYSPRGTLFGARALPGRGPYEAYRVLKALDVEAGVVAPAFGRPGLGIQYRASRSVDDLLKDEFLEVL